MNDDPVSQNQYDERTGYYEAYLMLRSQFAELIILSSAATDPRIRDMTEYAIASLVSAEERNRLYGVLEDQVCGIDPGLDNETRGRLARRLSIRIWGEISSWYDEHLSIVTYNVWGVCDTMADWEDRIAKQTSIECENPGKLIIGGPVMRARVGYYAAHMGMRMRFASLLSQSRDVTDPRIRDMTEYAISGMTNREERERILDDLDGQITIIQEGPGDNEDRAQAERSACIRVWGLVNDWYDNLAGVEAQNVWGYTNKSELTIETD